MSRSFLLLALSCLLGACAAPKKAELVDEPAPKPVEKKPSVETAAEEPPVPVSANPGGLRLPPRIMDPPEDKDFQATAAPGPQGGAPVISAPPVPAE